jgi:hypothetical protein
VEVGRIPCAEEDAPVGRVLLDLADDLGQLVDALAGIIALGVDIGCPKMPPLEAVDRSEVALLAMTESARGEEGSRAVAVPDMDALSRERQGRRRAGDEPEELLEWKVRQESSKRQIDCAEGTKEAMTLGAPRARRGRRRAWSLAAEARRRRARSGALGAQRGRSCPSLSGRAGADPSQSPS